MNIENKWFSFSIMKKPKNPYNLFLNRQYNKIIKKYGKNTIIEDLPKKCNLIEKVYFKLFRINLGLDW